MRIALLACIALVAAQNKWTEYPTSDCGYDDEAPQPACAKSSDIVALKTCCEAHADCGGFNFCKSRGYAIMKKLDCIKHKSSEASCDLYVLEGRKPPPPKPNFPPVWPMPQNFTNGTNYVTVSSQLKFTSTKTSATLTSAFERYQSMIFAHASDTSDSAMVGIDVDVTAVDESHPQIDTDESYTLTIGADGSNAKLSAKTIYGAMHGLETFSQLVYFDFESTTYKIAAAPWQINDAPRFPHRGLMLDTSRHYEPINAIKKLVTSLPFSKINVFHWHMSDSQSMPFQSKTYPKLWMGAYSNQEKYTQLDIASVVEYARLRGVRVMVEFDMPGHAGSWCKGYPEVCPSPSCTQPLNVANNATFDLIASVLNECTGGKTSTPGNPMGLFPDNFIHLGGDEVNTGCWTKTPAVQAWLTKQGFSADDGYAYFVKRVAEIAIAQGRRPVQWVEVFDHFGSKLDKRTIVHVWKAESTLVAVVKAGYNALLSNAEGSNNWYLDHLNTKWDAAYSNEPCPSSLTDKECALVLGGQGEMWGETVDASDLEQTVWPRLGAIGERLWSPKDVVETAAALPRIEAFRCLLNRRGVRAAPVNNAVARSAPHGAGGCYEQR
jgi:hexosaminidase